MFVNNWGMVRSQFLPNNKERDLVSTPHPGDYPTATEHGSSQHCQEVPLPFSALWEGEDQARKVLLTPKAFIWQSSQMKTIGKRAEGVWQIKTILFYHLWVHQCGLYREMSPRARAESVPKLPTSIPISDPGPLFSWLTSWPPTPLHPPSSHMLSVMLPQLKQHRGAFPMTEMPMPPSPGRTNSTWHYWKEPLCFYASPGNTVINNFRVILLQ